MKILGNRVLIEKNKEISATKNGFLIQKTVDTGKVVEVGVGKMAQDGKIQPMEVKKDDIVMYKYSEEVLVDGVKYDIVSESDIIMIL